VTPFGYINQLAVLFLAAGQPVPGGNRREVARH
jgi:hypothetical protein